MKRMIVLFVILFVSVWIGIRINSDPGYLMLAYKNWTIEMPLWLLIAGVALAFVTLYALIRSLIYLSSLSYRFGTFVRRQKLESARSRTSRGLIAFTEGLWDNAEQDLLKAIPSTDTPLINYLSAARAAQEQGAFARRDKYLRQAQQCEPDAKIAITLTQAQLQIDCQQYEQAIATLKHLYQIAPKHQLVLKQLAMLYEQLEDWIPLLALLPKCKKMRIMNDDELERFSEKVMKGFLSLHVKRGELNNLMVAWEQLPRSAHKNISLNQHYAELLLALGGKVQAENLLKALLKKHWNGDLIRLYGLSEATDPKKQFAFAEKCAAQHPENAQALLAAGRLAKRLELWGKARLYLENALRLKPSTSIYAELASLLESINAHDMAAHYYREGLLAATAPKGILASTNTSTTL